MIVNIDLSQEIFVIDRQVEGIKILSETLPEACSAIVTTIWRPGLRPVYIAITMFAQQLFSKDLTGSLLEAITSIRRPIYTYLYVLILIVLFSFVCLQM